VYIVRECLDRAACQTRVLLKASLLLAVLLMNGRSQLHARIRSCSSIMAPRSVVGEQANCPSGSSSFNHYYRRRFQSPAMPLPRLVRNEVAAHPPIIQTILLFTYAYAAALSGFLPRHAHRRPKQVSYMTEHRG